MSENAKTITFVVIGLVAIVVGLVTRPSTAELDVETLLGENLTKAFNAPEEAKRLRIVRFEEDTATIRDFEVAEQDGLWAIPSKDGYPADAARQMAEAATSLMDRKILHIASRSAGDHEQYGVIDPLSPKLEPGQKGVGTRVTMSNADGKPLADLIIGKRVKDAEGQRYVREAGRDIVYIIEIDAAKLSTNFENWIEKDLLKLNPWDLQQVEIKDYSAELVPVMTRDGRLTVQPTWDPRSEMTLTYNDTESKWNAVRLRKFDPQAGQQGDYEDFTLAEDEELNEKALTDLKNALDDLQIVDVARKPAGLSKDLKAGEDFMNNAEALKDLMSRGFTPAATADGAGEIISSDGEVIATMKNGTEYVLRFGNLTNRGGGNEGEEATEGESAEAKPEAKDGNVNRYLFVMARFNEAAVKQPELQQLPELPAGATENAEQPSEQSESAGEVPAETNKGAEADNGAAQEAATEVENPTKSDDEESTEAANDDAESEESNEAEKPEDDAKAGDTADAKEEPKDESDVEKIIADRKRIEQENQRKLDEYQELLKKGRENVKELNLRFGDWYFVVDDNVFRKIRLSREDVIKKKEKPEAEDANESTSDPSTDAAAPPAGIPGLPQIPGTDDAEEASETTE